jgi:hypothetical protein
MARAWRWALAVVGSVTLAAASAAAQTAPLAIVVASVESVGVGSNAADGAIEATVLEEGASGATTYLLFPVTTSGGLARMSESCERNLRQSLARPGRYTVRLALASRSGQRAAFTKCAIEPRAVTP